MYFIEMLKGMIDSTQLNLYKSSWHNIWNKIWMNGWTDGRADGGCLKGLNRINQHMWAIAGAAGRQGIKGMVLMNE